MSRESSARSSAVYRERRPDFYVKHVEDVRKWRQNNPDKYKAHITLNNAVRSGKVVKPTCCSKCNKEGRIEGSHDDYNKPLEVEWLCRQCHAAKDFPA
jgi:hypothetical protein